jgi:hypothetical protein
MDGYRVDRRDFNPGERIDYTGVYFKNLTNTGKIVEDVLELYRPDGKPKRDTMLHVFEDLGPARKFWSKMKDGNLYKVQVDNAFVRHRGDMQLTEKVKHLVEQESEPKSAAMAYWNGEQTENPENELLVEYAVVTEVVSKSNDERRAYLIKRIWG